MQLMRQPRPLPHKMMGLILHAVVAAATAAPAAAPFVARLNPPASSGPITVVEIDQDSVPDGVTWFHLRPSAAGGSMPSQIMGHSATGMWFPRTAPKIEGRGPVGIQQFPFSGTSMFNAGNSETVCSPRMPCMRTALS